MILADIQYRRRAGMKLVRRLHLETGDFGHNNVVRRRLLRDADKRNADVADDKTSSFSSIP